MIRIGVWARVFSRQLRSHHVTARLPTVSSNFVRRFAVEIPREKFESPKELISGQDSDTFGSLSVNEQPADDELIDEDDIKEDEFLKHPPSKSQKLSTKAYADMIKDHLNNKRIKEAIDVLEVKMLKEDRVKPENYIFNLLIDGCAKVGYSKKAFNLFTRMRQRALKVTGATYTSLFNACANAPWAGDSLLKANRVREIMLERGFEPNASNYNAMIKAYGRCNDLKTAFQIVDEMSGKNLAIEVETFNFLLQACASDKEFGFRHALLVWHKMYMRKLKPDIYSFNLMLRCVRDTEFGDVESMEQVLQTLLLSGSIEADTEQLKLEAHSSSDNKVNVQIESTQEVSSDPTPNLLAPRPHLGNLISLEEVKKPEDKLLLLGGFSGFLDIMKQFNVKPDLKTYTELIDVIPPTLAAEKRLLKQLKKQEIKCDVDFFNILMKKRSMRYDYQGAREVLRMIEMVKLQPDIVTYGVLALGCTTREEARALMQEMDHEGIKMNIQILGAMLKTGCVKKDFEYVMEILYMIKDVGVKPNDKIMEMIERLIKTANFYKKKDQRSTPDGFRVKFGHFKVNLERWKEAMGMKGVDIRDAKKIFKDAPWEQFQSTQADGYEDPKGLQQRKISKLKRYIGKIKHPKEDIE